MSTNRIFFITPDINTPTGGIKQLYRQVDVLNKNGFDAYILHQKSGFRCTWFINETRVASSYKILTDLDSLLTAYTVFGGGFVRSAKNLVKKIIKKSKFILSNNKNDIVVRSEDIFVFPEVYGPNLAELLKGNSKVIYNQGAYQTFFHYNLSLTNYATPYLNSELIATVVNSENAKEYVSHVFPSMSVHRVRYGIDSKNFFFSENKKKKIAFMPRRLRVDLIQVINILKFKGLLEDWELVEIHNMNEQQVADALRECALFLSFSINEGFGMPPAEAMACGCVVVGYSGKGGKEFFKEDFCYPVADRDVLLYAKTLEEVIRAYDEDDRPFLAKGKKASEFILSEYSMEMEEKTIVACWNKILSKHE
ncbi:MAG: glycosyltransferase [Flavobacteriaceae bacterium]|nr:glycosyltransferase [Flavobacteriaceae bacterium]